MAVAITTNIREKVGGRNPRRDRRDGRIPAIVYGRGEEPVPVCVPLKEIEKAVHSNTRVVELRGLPGNPQVAIREVQWAPVGEDIVHVDFVRIALDEVIIVSVSVDLVGTPKGISGEGILDQPTKELEVSCLPADIPEIITINIVELGEGEEIRVKDVAPPEGVIFTAGPDTIICRVIIPVIKGEEETAETFDMPERIGEDKTEEGAGETKEG
ncbi:MAG: 50S ribosomal protein L25 [Planctomycetota bacterium]|nr:MAG: 50S ribosomal protein L25 [Planctomycetota bacterium]